MVITGIGVDLVEIGRVEGALQRFGDRLAARLLSGDEFGEWRTERMVGGRLAEQSAAARWLAKRFAAKEAAAKALGTGFGRMLAFADIGVAHEASGRPFLVFSARAAKLLQERAIARAHLTLADERSYALAFVVLEAGARGDEERMDRP